MEPGGLVAIMSLAIPIVAIIGGISLKMMKLRLQHRSQATPDWELEQTVENLKRANAEMAHRLENLETIVVSQTWSAVQRGAAVAPHELPAPAAEEMNRQRVEQLARRLGG